MVKVSIPAREASASAFRAASAPSSTALSPRPKSSSPATGSGESLPWTRPSAGSRRLRFDGGAEVEIRPIFEADDFGKEFTPELRAQEERLRAEIAERK